MTHTQLLPPHITPYHSTAQHSTAQHTTRSPSLTYLLSSPTSTYTPTPVQVRVTELPCVEDLRAVLDGREIKGRENKDYYYHSSTGGGVGVHANANANANVHANIHAGRVSRGAGLVAQVTAAGQHKRQRQDQHQHQPSTRTSTSISTRAGRAWVPRSRPFCSVPSNSTPAPDLFQISTTTTG